MKPAEGRQRVVIEDVRPQVDCGRFPVKRIAGERLVVTAAVYGDGHDVIAVRLLYRRQGERAWRSAPMTAEGNDIWSGSFVAESEGKYQYSVEGWVDEFATWLGDFKKRAQAGQDLSLAWQSGALLVEKASRRAKKGDARRLREAVAEFRERGESGGTEGDAVPAADVVELMQRYPDLRFASRYKPDLELEVDRERAGFSAWYELFPRSTSPVEGRHGTFRDTEAWLPYIAGMGFDVLYLPPIHPIGTAFRKGPNNAVEAAPGDFGSPWAIGSAEGGHTAIHPELGTLEDFQHLVAKVKEAGMEIALDIAFQCSPDHPWVSEHPAWFRHRPDGSIQYAENPPKKYQDIYPLDFESDEWRSLWDGLRDVFVYWAEQGVRIFRVDNPHTKAFAFWEWVIPEVKKHAPDAVFLAEAFTRPHVMYGLAKRGFSQSYTYFTWRTGKEELTEYFTDLSQTEVKEFFRPNVWPNTPDILHQSLQNGGRATFIYRAILAATLSPNYGIYGPAYELGEQVPIREGSEEYLHSEKYQLRSWDREAPHSIAPLIMRLNQIRRSNAALRNLTSLRFHETGNEFLICYSKQSEDGRNVLLMVVNLDPLHTQSGWTQLDLKELGVAEEGSFTVRDLLNKEEYVWSGPRNYIELAPESRPAHILEIVLWNVSGNPEQPGSDQERSKFDQ